MTAWIAIGAIVALIGGALGYRQVTKPKGWLWTNVHEDMRNTFRVFQDQIMARTGWDAPKVWKVKGIEGEELHTLCGSPMWCFSLGGVMIGGHTAGTSKEMSTLIGYSPDTRAYCHKAVFHEVFQGMAFANGKIPQSAPGTGPEGHPKELLQYIPDEYKCVWR